MSKYKLPNGLIVELNDQTGEITVVGGGGRTVANGTRLTEGGDLLAAPAGTGPQNTPAELTHGPKDLTDEEAGISPNPLATPQGRTLPSFHHGSQPLSELQPPPEASLGHEDPLGTAIVTAAGAAPARALGTAAGKILPELAPAVEGAAVGAPAAFVDRVDPADAARGAAAGAGLGTVVSALPAVGDAAKARIANRLPTTITKGARTAASKAVVAGRDLLQEATEADPELGKVLGSGAADAEKLAAVEPKISALNEAQDAAYDAIAKGHPEAVGGRIPTSVPVSKLGLLKLEAHKSGDESLMDAVDKALDSIKRFEKDGGIEPGQLRGIRNDLAEKLGGGAAPGSPIHSAAKADALAVKSALNEAIADLADETPSLQGVSGDEIRARGRHLVALNNVRDALNERIEKEALTPPDAASKIGKVAHAVAHPLKTTAKLIDRAAVAVPSRIDQHLAKLAGSTGPRGVTALKAVVANPSRQTIQAAIAEGIQPTIALQVAKLGAQRPAVAQ